MKAGALTLLLLLLALLAGGCAPRRAVAPAPAVALFEDITARSGVDFRHDNGFAGKFYFVESTPGGVALFDFDNDGLLDLFLVQSGSSAPTATVKERPSCRLYRNRGDGAFQDMTAGSGLDRDLGYGHGVAVGDIDNDGYDDLFVTAYGTNHLFRNVHGSGRFEDVTRAWGLGQGHGAGFATSAAFGDIDNDGRLDLYVCYYSTWTWAKDKPCADARGDAEYCTPEIYEPDTHQLLRNAGNRFVDVSAAAGIAAKTGRGLAVAFLDYNDDGLQDIFVANDMSPNFLWKNVGGGRFAEVAGEAGCAYNGDGVVMAGMGIAVGDYDHSGRESLYVTDFSNKVKPLFHLGADHLFLDKGRASGKDLISTSHYLAFGTTFLDFDADGWLDLAINNGHVNYRVDRNPGGITYKEPKQLFHNQKGAFREIADPAALGPLAAPRVGRGLAVGDLDNDGRLDLVAVNQNDPVQLLRNRDKSPNHWVSFRPVGTRSNRDGVHAVFTLHAGGIAQTASVRGGSSYLSVSDRRVYFGLGSASRIEKVTIHWSSGLTQVLKDVPVDAFHTVTEGKGVTATQKPRLTASTL